jgi:hypothetical protein
MMIRFFLLFAAVAGASLLPASINAETLEDVARGLETLDRNASAANDAALVAANFVTSPLGRWTLLRKGQDLCAIRFTRFRHERAKDRIPSITTDSFFADYDWVYQGDGSGDLVKANAKAGHLEASVKPNIWRFMRGERFVSCRSYRTQWWYPNRIFLIKAENLTELNPSRSTHPNDIEVALTGWKEIGHVNVHDPKLVWRRLDPERDSAHIDEEPKIIPVTELPGYE